MKANKLLIISIISTLIIGILIGWLLFGSGSKSPAQSHEELAGAEAEKTTTYTCSMHPQIRQNEPGDCPICGMDLIPLEEDQDDEIDPRALRMSATAMQLASIETAEVMLQKPVKTLLLNGKVQIDERYVYTQSMHIPGRIERLLVNFTGEFVTKGQTVAEVYSPELVTAQKELIEAQSIKETQPQLFQSARQKLKNWKLTDGQIDRILANETPQEIFSVLADASGYVTERIANPGDYLQAGEGIYQLANLSKVWVMFDVYESDMVWIKKGDPIEFTIASLPGETFQGTVTFIDPVINPKSRVAKARVETVNTQMKLKPEMFVSGKLEAILPEREQALVVPKSAVMWTGKRSLVYVKSETDKGIAFMMREVMLGPALGDSYIIETGLRAGEEIAVSGTFSIDAAAQLAGKPSMMNTSESNRLEAPEAFMNQLVLFTSEYFKFKNALVNTDYAGANKQVQHLRQSLAAIDMQLLSDKSHNSWMKLQKSMNESLELLVNAKEIKEQRLHFSDLSNALIEAIQAFGYPEEAVFVAYCPMAFDDEGAYWLSEFKPIKNPYFGDMMLTCGEVKQTISADQNANTVINKPPAGHQH